MKNKISKADYDQLPPFDQGYLSYMQGAWNDAIPNENPYPMDTEQFRQWQAGELEGVLEAQDSEE